MTKHTPTPWVAKDCDEAGEMYDVDGVGLYSEADLALARKGEGTSSAICFMNENWGEFESNAAFIVRAVNAHEEMAKALESIARVGIHEIHDWKSVAERMQATALAALDKAKG